MNRNYHQTVEEILSAASPEQKLLWNWLFLRFGERITISQFLFFGTAGGELTNFVAGKIYVCYEFNQSATPTPGAANNFTYFFDENNAIVKTTGDNMPYWDATAAAVRYISAETKANNFYFSRLTATGANRIKFIGYRITGIII